MYETIDPTVEISRDVESRKMLRRYGSSRMGEILRVCELRAPPGVQGVPRDDVARELAPLVQRRGCVRQLRAHLHAVRVDDFDADLVQEVAERGDVIEVGEQNGEHVYCIGRTR